MATMTFPNWEKRFQPEPNTIDPNNESGMFETYGEELEFVKYVNGVSPGCVWTIVEGEKSLRLTNGFHHVNRIGYIITKIECPEEEDHDIKWA